MMTAKDRAGVLRLVPKIDFGSGGDYRQALGLDLPVAVINLVHRTDKWAAISTRMAAVGLDKLIKVPAVEGAKLSLDGLAPILAQAPALIEAAPKSHFTMTRPAVGCFLSHLAVWQWLIASGLPRLMVFEDDAFPAADFDAVRFRKVLGSIPEAAGLVLLGRIIMNGMADAPQHSELARIFFFNGTFAYLITPAAARTLTHSLLPMNGHIDCQISQVLIDQRRDFAAYSVEPPLFEPDWSLRSDCYVPMEGVTDADREFGALLNANRQRLLDDGRPLLPAFGDAAAAAEPA